MFRYEHLLGRDFALGRTDCYALVRDFYQDNLGIEMRNYARPDFFWDHGLNLYIDNFRAEGFRLLHVHPKDYQPGDAILMAIRAPIANHAAILLDDGRILHHMAGCKSRVESFNRALYRDSTVALLRHPAVKLDTLTQRQDLRDLLPPVIRRKLADA